MCNILVSITRWFRFLGGRPRHHLSDARAEAVKNATLRAVSLWLSDAYVECKVYDPVTNSLIENAIVFPRFDTGLLSRQLIEEMAKIGYEAYRDETSEKQTRPRPQEQPTV